MRAVRVLLVCGSGTVSSAMLSQKLTDILEENGYELESTQVSPNDVSFEITNKEYDLIVYTSPIDVEYAIPLLNATGFLLGINAEEFIEELLYVVGKLTL